jgi:hypothetical protein
MAIFSRIIFYFVLSMLILGLLTISGRYESTIVIGLFKNDKLNYSKYLAHIKSLGFEAFKPETKPSYDFVLTNNTLVTYKSNRPKFKNINVIHQYSGENPSTISLFLIHQKFNRSLFWNHTEQQKNYQKFVSEQSIAIQQL